MTSEPEHGVMRPTCPQCRFIWYRNPVPAAGVILVRDGQVLLVKRKYEPRAGYWCLPAGFMEAGETPEQSATRELLEETGVIAQLSGLFGVYAGFDDPRVRKAFALALDRKKLAAKIVRSGETPTSHFTPKGMGVYEPPDGWGYDPEQARQVVYKLSKILRRLLRKHENFTALRDELSFIEDYLAIEMIRFGDKLRFTRDIDDVVVPRPDAAIRVVGMPKGRAQHDAAIVMEQAFRPVAMMDIEVGDGHAFESTALERMECADLDVVVAVHERAARAAAKA